MNERSSTQYATLSSPPASSTAVVSQAMLEEARAAVDTVHVAPELLGYVLDLAQASRQHAHLTLGLSTRGALAALRAARIAAALRGATFVNPDDVKDVLPTVRFRTAWCLPPRPCSRALQRRRSCNESSSRHRYPDERREFTRQRLSIGGIDGGACNCR